MYQPTWTGKVCKMIACWALFRSFGQSFCVLVFDHPFYVLWGVQIWPSYSLPCWGLTDSSSQSLQAAVGGTAVGASIFTDLKLWSNMPAGIVSHSS